MILLIDNYDSFTYNLYHLIIRYYDKIKVIRNDKMTIDDIEEMAPKAIVISPGPATPDKAGICLDAINAFYKIVPMFGVCLGMQSIAQAFGATISNAKSLMHGKVSPVYHNNEGIFKDIPSPFLATRYHSLSIKEDTLPKDFNVTATVEDKEIMAIEHKDYPLHAVQFHPESIETEYGDKIIQNFISVL